MRRLALLVLAAAASAAPRRELVREEAFNYRVVGELPPGWKGQPATLTYTFSIDEIPHAHVRLVRERVGGTLDVEAQLRKRAPQYRFPSAPDDAPWTVKASGWADRPAFLFEHEAKVGGVLCRRRVRALFAKSIWYELIETVFGEETEKEEACAEGLRVFRDGFRLLTQPVAEEAAGRTGAETCVSEEFGYRLLKPEGFRRIEVDTGADPGCRLAFERAGPGGRHARVRLFEYGTREVLDAEQWISIFFTGFGAAHRKARQEPEEAPGIAGASKVWAVRFEGERDQTAVTTRLYLVQSGSGRVFVLRIRTVGDAFRDALDEMLRTFRVEDR